jgi:hypothetical protein
MRLPNSVVAHNSISTTTSEQALLFNLTFQPCYYCYHEVFFAVAFFGYTWSCSRSCAHCSRSWRDFQLRSSLHNQMECSDRILDELHHRSVSWTTACPSIYRQLDLMSGSNNDMSFVANVASGLDGTDPSLSPYSWPCPDVSPYSSIYFYQVSDCVLSNQPLTSLVHRWRTPCLDYSLHCEPIYC